MELPAKPRERAINISLHDTLSFSYHRNQSRICANTRHVFDNLKILQIGHHAPLTGIEAETTDGETRSPERNCDSGRPWGIDQRMTFCLMDSEGDRASRQT